MSKVSYRLSSLLTEVRAHGWTKEREGEAARILDAVHAMESSEHADLAAECGLLREKMEKVEVRVAAQVVALTEALDKLATWAVSVEHTLVPRITEMEGVIEGFLGAEEMAELRARARDRLETNDGER